MLAKKGPKYSFLLLFMYHLSMYLFNIVSYVFILWGVAVIELGSDTDHYKGPDSRTLRMSIDQTINKLMKHTT